MDNIETYDNDQSLKFSNSRGFYSAAFQCGLGKEALGIG
jgi:hypothetical protein